MRKENALKLIAVLVITMPIIYFISFLLKFQGWKFGIFNVISTKIYIIGLIYIFYIFLSFFFGLKIFFKDRQKKIISGNCVLFSIDFCLNFSYLSEGFYALSNYSKESYIYFFLGIVVIWFSCFMCSKLKKYFIEQDLPSSS